MRDQVDACARKRLHRSSWDLAVVFSSSEPVCTGVRGVVDINRAHRTAPRMPNKPCSQWKQLGA